MKTMTKKTASLRKFRGQGMTEYIIIVALIAIAAIGVITIFGDNIRAIFGASTNALNGDNGVEINSSNAGTSQEARTIKNFNTY